MKGLFRDPDFEDERLNSLTSSAYFLRFPSPETIQVLNAETRDRLTVSTNILKQANMMKQRQMYKEVYFEKMTAYEIAKITVEIEEDIEEISEFHMRIFKFWKLDAKKPSMVAVQRGSKENSIAIFKYTDNYRVDRQI